MNNFHRTFALSLLATLGLGSCGAQVGVHQAATRQDIHIGFSAQVAGKEFACGESYDGIGVTHSKITGSDLRFYVSSVELIASDGSAVPVQLDQDGVWQYKDVALLDFEDGSGSCSNGNAAMHKEISGSVPAGDYVGLRFALGVPFELDHMDSASAPSPLNTSAMFWVWQSGYKFLRAEVKTLGSSPVVMKTSAQTMGAPGMKPKARATGFVMHLGSTGCTAPSVTSAPSVECEHPNRPLIQFSQFNVSKDVVVFDLAKLLQDVNLNGGEGPMSGSCMSSPKDVTCAAPMKALGVPFGDMASPEQNVFSREAR